MELLKWADENGKTIITTGENGIDFSIPVGKLLAFIISWLGEQELAAITKRNRGAQAWLKANDYLVGRPPFGYKIVDSAKHKTLAPDEATAGYVVAMYERYLAGDSLTATCQWLDDQNVKPVTWQAWDKADPDGRGPEPIWSHRFCVTRFTRGRRKDAAGRTVLKVPPIVDATLARNVAAKLDASPRKRGAAGTDTAMLTGVLFCGKCNGPMYRIQPPKNAEKCFYRCAGTARKPSKCRNMIPLAYLDEVVNDAVIAHEHEPQKARKVTAGETHDAEIEAVEQDIRDLDLDDPDYLSKQAALLAEHKALKELPDESDTIDDVPTGRTVGQVWQALDINGKRAWLIGNGWKAYAQRDSDREVIVTVEGGELFATVESLQAL